jgi:hypothetical protein
MGPQGNGRTTALNHPPGYCPLGQLRCQALESLAFWMGGMGSGPLCPRRQHVLLLFQSRVTGGDRGVWFGPFRLSALVA